jgi:hypothetical protein
MANSEHPQSATGEDIKSILGEIDPGRLLDILALQPTVRDLEEVKLFVSGDQDIFGAGTALKGVPAQILEIIADDEVEPDR